MNQNRLSLFESAPFGRTADRDVDEIDLVALLRAVWRGRLWILMAMSIGIAIAWYQTNIRSVPLYQASATLTLEPDQAQVVSFDSVVQGFSGDDASVATEIRVIQSRALIGKLVDRLELISDPEFNGYLDTGDPAFSLRRFVFDRARSWGLLPLPEAYPTPTTEVMREATVNAVQGSISVVNPEWTYVLTVSAVAQSSAKAALLANTLATLYIEDRIEVKFDRTRQATEWLSARVAELRQEVEASEGALKAFRAEADLISRETLEALNLRLKDQRERLDETIASEAAAEFRLAALTSARDAGDFDAMAAAASDPALGRLAERITGGDEGARVLFERRYDQLIARARDERDRATAQSTVLERSVSRQEQEISLQSDELVALQQLEREAEANRLIYEYFLTRLKETSVQEGIQQADARIISPAVPPYGPFSPNEPRMLVLGALVGLILGAGAVIFREQFVSSIRDPDELEALTSLPVLGQIPRIPGSNRLAIVNYLMAKPASAAVEAVRSLRTSLLLSNIDAPPQVIMVTSAVPGEGKTTTAFALANNFAALGKRVLIIEGDIRRRVMSDFLDAGDASLGLLDVLSGQTTMEEAVQRPDGLRFDVLFGSESSVNPADVLSSRQFGALVEEARTSYEIVIFDTPPLLVVSDARVIGQQADAILFTVLWNKTTRAQITDALRQLSSVGLRVTGLVLQNIDPKGMRKLGLGDRYGAYSSTYGKSYYRN